MKFIFVDPSGDRELVNASDEKSAWDSLAGTFKTTVGSMLKAGIRILKNAHIPFKCPKCGSGQTRGEVNPEKKGELECEKCGHRFMDFEAKQNAGIAAFHFSTEDEAKKARDEWAAKGFKITKEPYHTGNVWQFEYELKNALDFDLLRREYASHETMPMSAVPKLQAIITSASDDAILQLIRENIKFVSKLAVNEAMRRGLDWKNNSEPCGICGKQATKRGSYPEGGLGVSLCDKCAQQLQTKLERLEDIGNADANRAWMTVHKSRNISKNRDTGEIEVWDGNKIVKTLGSIAQAKLWIDQNIEENTNASESERVQKVMKAKKDAEAEVARARATGDNAKIVAALKALSAAQREEIAAFGGDISRLPQENASHDPIHASKRRCPECDFVGYPEDVVAHLQKKHGYDTNKAHDSVEAPENTNASTFTRLHNAQDLGASRYGSGSRSVTLHNSPEAPHVLGASKYGSIENAAKIHAGCGGELEIDESAWPRSGTFYRCKKCGRDALTSREVETR